MKAKQSAALAIAVILTGCTTQTPLSFPPKTTQSRPITQLLVTQQPTAYTASCWVMTTNQPVTLQFAYDIRGPWYNVTNVQNNTYVEWPITNWNAFARTYITIP